jgi:hypothetical protein
MLIKRTQPRSESDRRGSVAAALSGQAGGLDRRTFLRRSGLAGGALAALGTLPIGSVRKAEAAAAGPLTSGATVRKSICTHCAVGCTVTAEVLNGGKASAPLIVGRAWISKHDTKLCSRRSARARSAAPGAGCLSQFGPIRHASTAGPNFYTRV